MEKSRYLKKINSECLDEIVNHKPMMLEDILTSLQLEFENTNSDIKTRLKNIKLYSTFGLLLLDNSNCLVTGKQNLNDNCFYRDLISLMNTGAFKTFRSNHMTNDIQASLIYFELYEMLDIFYTKKTGVSIPDDIGIELLKTIMEKKEKIECLRYIENGKKIKMVKTDFSGISIDTPEDLIRAEEYLKRQ